MKKKIVTIIGARPQFIKHAPLETYLKKWFDLYVIHTGQHYDSKMSDIFFKELGIEEPNIILNVANDTHAKQTGNMMIEIENILLKEKPDGVLVYGDTNSTIAGALASQKLGIPIFHVEAGLRSYNKEMPEEINRILTDHMATLMFCPTENSQNNLKREGIDNGVFTVGDVMYDLLNMSIDKNIIKQSADIEPYYYVTIHRPYNTDSIERMKAILKSLNSLNHKVFIALHPRTVKQIKLYNISLEDFKNLKVLEPQSYFDNLSYLYNSEGLITDSGGMQKEAYWLKKKCITVRTETEWVETLEGNWNQLVFHDLDIISELLEKRPFNHKEDVYGIGNTSLLICEKLVEYFNNN